MLVNSSLWLPVSDRDREKKEGRLDILKKKTRITLRISQNFLGIVARYREDFNEQHFLLVVDQQRKAMKIKL